MLNFLLNPRRSLSDWRKKAITFPPASKKKFRMETSSCLGWCFTKRSRVLLGILLWVLDYKQSTDKGLQGDLLMCRKYLIHWRMKRLIIIFMQVQVINNVITAFYGHEINTKEIVAVSWYSRFSVFCQDFHNKDNNPEEPGRMADIAIANITNRGRYKSNLTKDTNRNKFFTIWNDYHYLQRQCVFQISFPIENFINFQTTSYNNTSNNYDGQWERVFQIFALVNNTVNLQTTITINFGHWITTFTSHRQFHQYRVFKVS